MNNHLLPLRVLATSAFKSVLIALLALTAISASYAQGTQQKRAPRVEIPQRNHAMVPDDPEAIYEGARVVHNVTVDGEKGMRIHATFRVKYGLDTACMLIAYYFYDDGEPLKTDEPKYRTKTGTVYSHANFTPAYDPAVYKDLQLFMPYSALNMESGDTYDLKFYLALYDKEGGRFFGKSGWYKFKLTMP